MLNNPSWTLDQAIAHFDAVNARGKVPDRMSGGTRRSAEPMRRVILNDVRHALARASGVSTPGDVSLTPYLEVLTWFARVEAEEEGRSRPANRVASVRLFLAVVEGCEPKTTRRAIAETFRPPWRPLYEAVAGLEITNANARQPRHRRYPGFLAQFADFLLRHGVAAPEEIPAYSEVRRWAEAEGRGKPLANWLTAYRSGRTALGSPSTLPTLAPSPLGLHRGLRGLELAPLLRRVGCHTPPADLSVPETLRALAPGIAAAVEHYISHAGKSASWNINVTCTASCVVAELIRMGMADELAELDLLDLLERRVPVEVAPSQASTAGLLRRRLGAPAGGGGATVSLLRKYVDAAARHSLQHSPIRPTAPVPDGAVPYYTTAIFNEVSAIWHVAEYVYGRAEGFADEGMIVAQPEEWARLRLECDLVREHMARTNVERQAEGFKQKGLVTITWSQAVCVGLPRLWQEARALRDAYHLAYAGRGDLSAPSVQLAQRRYFRALKRYMLAAVLLDDGLRVANYAGGRVGRNFLAEVERAPDGSWRRIVAVASHFRGYCSEAKLKISRKGSSGAERERTRSLRPGIVDMELLSDFWLELRPRDLVTCGMLSSVESYDPDSDSFAFFVSPCSTRRAHGGYSPARLSRMFGRTLHWMMRDVLGRHDVPAWDELRRNRELSRKWRGLFGAHVTRLLIATYWGVVRERWSVAAELTNDRVSTLQQFYSVWEGWITECRTKTGIEHPDHFNRVIDLLRDGKVIDWSSFDPERPEQAGTVERGTTTKRQVA
jgi:hypothetical protein